MTGPAWTEDRTELLKKLWADGLSASQIAAELGGISRNSVIGKVHRLGLADRKAKVGFDATAGKRVRKPRRAVLQLGPRMPALPLQPIQEASAEPMDVIPIGQRCTILELAEGKCRWPIGDPRDRDGFFFCGGKAHGVYCGFHMRLAYQAARERRERQSKQWQPCSGSDEQYDEFTTQRDIG